MNHLPNNQSALIVQSTAPPGAGNELLFAIPANQRRQLLSATFLFTTSITTADRFVTLEIREPTGKLIYLTSSNQKQVASLSYIYSISPGGIYAAQTATGHVILPLPNFVIMGPGYLIGSVTTGLQATDTFTLIEMISQQWLDVPS